MFCMNCSAVTTIYICIEDYFSYDPTVKFRIGKLLNVILAKRVSTLMISNAHVDDNRSSIHRVLSSSSYALFLNDNGGLAVGKFLIEGFVVPRSADDMACFTVLLINDLSMHC
ncbi:hypothetical protein Tsp_12693 [Trichinella spiralis]|uniref:hypothetical protein n=1 Tax=Trichinella spiralis TaxID=6334 RepID=UPI0001EFEB52|nr:hypothetical protein Tsp_12693 [Trichinella spiralis]